MTPRTTRRSRAVSTTFASIFFLLILLSLIIMISLAYTSYNRTIQDRTEIDSQRAKEKITLSSLSVDDNDFVTSVTVNNTGTNEVKIRAIYVITSDTEASFILDPATYIPQTGYAEIPIPLGYIAFNPEDDIVVATERGIKTRENEGLLLYGSPVIEGYNPTRLYIGPLILEFEEFYYRKVKNDGSYDPNDQTWHLGWNVTPNTQVIWKLVVKNIEEKHRNLTLNRFSSFTLYQLEAKDSRSWYLQPEDLTSLTTLLPWNQTHEVYFLWQKPRPPSGNMPLPQNTPAANRECMVFLTLFGSYEDRGAKTPYAQTIPFEATTTVRQ